MSTPQRLSVLLVALAAPLASQGTFVTPKALTNSHGTIYNSIPWGPFVPSGNTQGEIMVQQIEDDFVNHILVLRSMAFRHQYDVAHVAKAYTAYVRLGDAASTSAGMSTSFAANFKLGGNGAVVFNGTINFPALTAHPRPPSMADCPVMFSVPYMHVGIDPLLWEVIISGTVPVLPTQFHERGPSSTHTAGVVGQGCAITGSSAAMDAAGSISTAAWPAPGTWTDTLANGPVSAPAALMIGDTASGYMGIPLPLNLALVGSPSCFLNINPVTFLNTSTTATGTASSSVPFTISPAVSGARLRTQWLALDGMNVRTSNGLDHSVPYMATGGTPWPQARVWANGWFGGSLPLVGTRQSNGLVVEWGF